MKPGRLLRYLVSTSVQVSNLFEKRLELLVVDGHAVWKIRQLELSFFASPLVLVHQRVHSANSGLTGRTLGEGTRTCKRFFKPPRSAGDLNRLAVCACRRSPSPSFVEIADVRGLLG